MASLERLAVLGDVWESDRRTRTRIGRLIEAAKDRGDDAAAALLAREAGEWAASLAIDVELIVGVPPSPDRPNRLVPVVAATLGEAWGVPVVEAVHRQAVTARLRDLDPADRPQAALDADYRVVGDVAGRDVVLLDDVVLTGTTLEHVAGHLLAAGARRVTGVALARSRRD